MTIAFLAWAVAFNAVAFNIEADEHRGIVYATWPDQECQHVRPVSSALDQRRGPSLLSGQACEVAQFFRIIDEQADRMDSLIGDLLDAGRIDTGTLSVAPEPSDVAVLVDQARGTFISGGGRHTVRIDLPPDLPRVMADRQRLVQVRDNLLANAARHAPESAPIRIAAEREGLYVAVSVADEGRGIAPDQLGQLFRKYTTAGDRKGGLGSGLGLAICKGLVEAQGGRIRAESGGVGLGARFTFTIPVKRLKRSPLGLDLYLWLTYRTFSLKRPLRLTWPPIYRQFGVDPAKANDKFTVRDFRTDCLRELKKIK